MLNKPPLLNWQKAITDYLHEFGKVIPAEFDDNEISMLRECIFKAVLLKGQYARNLKFITEQSKVGASAINQVKEDHYCQLQFMIQEFVRTVYSQFKNTELELDENIIKLIDTEIHLGNGNCFVILMVGRFSESKYLQSRIKQESSSKVKLIFIPPQPSVAIIKGVENVEK
ncbi:unnamed protein product [Rhizophagus irregularis]|nr:unnamed protein product [Rhizophagus irregularis]